MSHDFFFLAFTDLLLLLLSAFSDIPYSPFSLFTFSTIPTDCHFALIFGFEMDRHLGVTYMDGAVWRRWSSLV